MWEPRFARRRGITDSNRELRLLLWDAQISIADLAARLGLSRAGLSLVINRHVSERRYAKWRPIIETTVAAFWD